VNAGTAFLLALVILATGALAVASQSMPDPLAQFRTPDGGLTIPGRALTPELQRLLFHGNELQPYTNVTFVFPSRSPYPTERLVSLSFASPNLNVFVHPTYPPETWGSAIDHVIRVWFPPVDWHEVGIGIRDSIRDGVGWFFDLFTMNAKADTLTVDSTTVTVVDPAAATCTTSQSATAGDNAVLVMLSNRGPTAYTSVTYGPVSLSLIPGTASSGTGIVRTEMWFYQGVIPGGAQTMTATLVSGTAKHVCATVLLGGVWATTPTAGGTTASGTSTNPNISIAPASAGELAFAVLAIRGTTAPTAVTGTGAAATSLYGIAPTQCTAGGSSLCGAGANMPNPGTAITWTDGNNTDWVVAAVRVLPVPNCGVAAGNCYRIGAGGTWATGANWSNTSGGAACGCTPVATNNAVFNATPTGTTTLAAATTIASIDMTSFTGTLDTTASNWALTVNGPFAIQGTLLARNSTIIVTGDVDVLTAGTIVNLGASTWTVNGTWTNLSTSASWVAGTSTVTIRDAASGTLRFAALAGGTNEFNNLTLDASVTPSITYTMAVNALRMGATLTIRNSTGGATGPTILTTSASNLGITAGALAVATFGSLTANGSTISVNGNVNVSTANGYIVMGSSTWTVTGTWTNASTSASWSAGTGTVTFTSPMGGTMTFAGTNLPGNEFNNITFTSSAASAQTFTMATRAMIWGGTLNVSDGSSTTALATANLSLTGGALNVGNGGILTANASTITVSSVTMTGGTSGTITLTTSSFTSTGNWDTSGAGSVFTKGTSTVTLSGVGNVAILNASNNFNNLVISAAGTVTQSGLVDVSGTLTVNAGAVLASSTFALTVATLAANMAGGITAGAAGTKTITGNVSVAAAGFFSFGATTWNFGGSWTNSSTSGSWSAGTGTVVFNSGASRTMTFGNLGVSEFNNVQFSPTATATFTMATNGLRWGATLTLNNNATLSTTNLALTGTGGNLTVSNGATLAAGSSAVSVTHVTMTGGTSGTITASGSWTVAGNWDTSGAGSVFTGGSSTVTMNGAARTVKILNTSNGFGALTISGTVSAASTITLAGLFTVSGAFDTTGTSYGLSVGGGLTVSGAAGILRTNASTVAVAGNVTVNNASGYITSAGAGSWTVSGSWTNASTSASWNFAATITFNSSASQTMTFAVLPGGAAEFNDIVFNSGPSTATFTMATNRLIWSGTLTVQGGAGTTTLATSNLALTGGALAVGDAGVLTANASSVSVSNVSITGGTSGTLTLTSGTWTVSGNWDSSGPGATLTSGSSTVTFTGALTTVGLAPGQMFYNLTIVGTISATSSLTASGTLTINNGAILTKTGQSIAFNTLIENGAGSIADGAISAVNFSVTNSDSTNLTTISVFTAWISDSNYTWTHSSTVATSTITFTIGGNTTGYRFNVTKDAVDFANGMVNGSGQVIFTMLGSDPVVDVVISSPCGGNRYWIGGTGTWSQTAHWADSSGGTNGCSVPTSSNSVFFDANSGGGTVTVNVNAATASLNTTGWTGTIAIGSFDLAVSGDITHAAGIISIGASSNSGLTATGTLTLSGFAVLDGSAAASLVTISGDTSIATATAYFRMGSGTWTFSGSWSNSGTSANWAAGTGMVFFDSSSSQTMTFANLAGDEFHDVTFQSAASSGTITFTMAANGLRWNGALVIQDTAGSTTVLATSNLSMTGGSLAVGNSGVLTANASTVAVVDVTMTGGGTGTITLTNGAWTVSGRWDTSGAGSSFNKGTSTVTMSGTAKTVAILDATNGFSNLTISGSVTQTSAIDVRGTLSVVGTLTTSGNNITGGANLTISGGGSLIGTTSAIIVAGVTMNDAATNSISLTSGSISASGSWDTSGPSSALNAGSSTVTLTVTSGTIALGPSQAFASLVIAGSVSLASPLTVSSLTISVGGLAKGPHALTVNGNLTLAGGYLTSTSGTVSIAGNVDISSASSYIVFGSEAWTVSGNWTNASTSASWSSGSAVVTFNATSDQTMTFAGANLAGNEFSTIVFNSGSSTTTFTMASGGLVATAITIQGGPGMTIVTTSGSSLPITASALTVGVGGSLTANASVITIQSLNTSAGAFTAGTSSIVVNVSGGSINVTQTLYNLLVNPGISTTFASSITWSGALTLTGSTSVFNGNLTSTGPAALVFGSSTLSIAGSWNTSSATTLTSTSSSVTFTGASGSILLGAGQQFATLIIAGTVTLASDLTAETLTVANSSTLTMTSNSVAFKSLTVTGTIADGSVNVTNLTVTNSDTTALVTVSAFTEWSRGSSYAWTHSSSEPSQTITWTIGGNAAGIPYTVTKDGSSFTSGTVNGSGEVVFTMLGSDPDMRVTVHNPVPPPWWQSSYMLAIFPIGILLGVAMFAQRQRWRPAKAFLVDDNGRMLREFTLDPSCQVTYDQAVQAGILDAVDKPIKVTKYHGQTVRGDALGVVLLAYGPVTLEHVEFAREMLVQIQDKFEDAVKQRLEEARAQEANVAAQTEGLETRRTEVEARAAEVGSMTQQAQAVQTKIAADTEALEAKEQDLRRRENDLVENRKAVDELAQQVEELRTSIDRRTAEIQQQAAELGAKSETVRAREEAATGFEETLRERDDALVKGEAGLRDAMERLGTESSTVQGRLDQAGRREESLGRDQADLANAREKFEADQRELLEFKRSIDSRVSSVEQGEIAMGQLSKELAAREARIAPDEARLAERTDALAQKDAELKAHEDRLTTRTQALIAHAEELSAREMTLREDRVVLDEARGAFESDLREFEERRAQSDEDVRRRGDDLDGQAKALGESQLRLAQEKETLEAEHTEKSQAILSREIELEAREQSLREKEDAVRAQAEENARRFAELTAQDESLEIEAAKADQVRGDLDARKADLTNLAKALDGETARLRDAEKKAAEERRTWQTTLESEQALLKDQRDAFQQEAASARASWADRVMRIEAREVDLEDKEEKVRSDVDWIARSDEDLKRREKALEETSRSVAQVKATAEQVAKDAEQRFLEIESRERALREEAAHEAIELTKQTEALKQIETELTSNQADFEKERAAQTQRLHEMETELQGKAQTLDAKGREQTERESRIATMEESFRQSDLRLQQERADVQATAKQLESQQLELAQLKDRYESEAARVRSEAEGMQQSVAAKEAELHAERERIERDSSALQDTLGAKAKEMSVRERALTAREAELQTEEQELEARGRELESKERQAEAHLTEMSAQAMALIRREQDLDARGTQLDQTVRRFESEAAEKRREWESLQTSLRSQQAQFTTTSESRTAELTKKTEELEGRERSQRAAFAQLEMERSKLDAEAKAQTAKSAEAEAAWRRSEARLADLKTKEDELLRGRQSFESERSTWSARRTEELKQLEATRDAAAQQAQQAERLVAESQRRALVAEEAERAAKRQTTDLAAQQARLESRRSEAEKAERDAQGHLAQLQEASQKLAVKDMEIGTALKNLEARQVKLAASERDSAALLTELRSKKIALDEEAARIAASSDQLTTRQKDLESRTANLEAKMAQASTKEQALATELQRADNLMEDLTKKEHDLRAREEAAKASEKSLSAREATLVARDAEVRDGMRSLEKLRKEIDDQRGAAEEDRRAGKATREEADTTKRNADKIRAQADEMQAEVNKNLRFLQKKALDVLDQEEKIRARVAAIEGQEKSLDTRGEILEGKERALEADQAALDAKIAKLQAEIDRLRARLTDTEKSGGPTTAAMEEWKKDVENRVKIIQKKAMDLLDREEKLRKKEEELRALASQLGVNP